jgi:hypothetical protein
MKSGGGDDEVAKLQAEIDGVTRDTARLLLQPECDEAELWELDGRARELRARLREVARAQQQPRPHRVPAARSSGGMVSGG